jgi:hypothetical protein
LKGDRVEVWVDTGEPTCRRFEVLADANGRSVEVKTTRNMIEVAVVGRTGKEVKVDRFLAARVVALIEHKTEPDAVQGALL